MNLISVGKSSYPKESLKSFETAVAFVKEYGYEYVENVTYAKDDGTGATMCMKKQGKRRK